MYAYTETSYRAISTGEHLSDGEQSAETVPEIVLRNIQGIEVRSTRSLMLRSSDWTQVSDNNLTVQERISWATYRQLLRDIPEQPGFPVSIQWPVRPGMSQDAGNETGEQS